MDKNDVLDLDIRRKIYNFILKYPGKHVREMSRDMKIPKTTLIYHLKYLQKREFITASTENINTRFFALGKICEKNKKILSLVEQPIPRNIILYLCLYGEASQVEMVEFAKSWSKHPTKIGHYLKKHPTTLAFHLKKLIDRDVVEFFQVGNETKYRLKSPEEIFDLLIFYNKRLFGHAGERVVYWWEESQKDSVEKLFETFFEVFPHPYHV